MSKRNYFVDEWFNEVADVCGVSKSTLGERLKPLMRVWYDKEVQKL